LEAALVAFKEFQFEVRTGHHYLGGFIGEDDALREWLRKKTKHWEEAVADLATVAPNFPQTAYAGGLQKSLQQEWQFVQRVTQGIGPKFRDVELVLAKTFLLTLFGDDYHKVDPCRKLSCLPVKWAGLAIPDPTVSAEPNYEASVLLCSHILAAFRGVDRFRSANHSAVITEVKRRELKAHNFETNSFSMTALTSKLSCNNRRTIL
jgi:hypothetical protein